MTGIILSILTFPGIIIHELGHKLFCDLTGVKVIRVVLLKFGNPPGYVIHEKPTKYIQSFLITTGPFIIGTIIALLLFIFSIKTAETKIISFILFWVAFSSASHCFPSKSDAKVLWQETNYHLLKKNIFVIIGYPFVLIIWLANILKFFWFDFIYAGILFALVKYLF